jgi:hypothetical protein
MTQIKCYCGHTTTCDCVPLEKQTRLMKTQEEIEQLAERFADNCTLISDAAAYEGFIKGYTQCQQDIVEKYTEQDMIKFAFDTYYKEDMAKKYTEEDLRKAFNSGVSSGWNAQENKEAINADEYIQSLKNKTMNKFICSECGTKYSSPELTPPPGIKWSDGHICTPKPVENGK